MFILQEANVIQEVFVALFDSFLHYTRLVLQPHALIVVGVFLTRRVILLGQRGWGWWSVVFRGEVLWLFMCVSGVNASLLQKYRCSFLRRFYLFRRLLLLYLTSFCIAVADTAAAIAGCVGTILEPRRAIISSTVDKIGRRGWRSVCFVP